MTPEQWEDVRLNHDRTCTERDHLRALLNQAMAELPASSSLHTEIRKALGLRVEIAA